MNVFDQFDHNIYGHDDYTQHDDGGYIHDGIGHYDAHLVPLDPNMAGYHDVMGMDYSDYGNAHCILCEADPLVHAHSYHAHPLLFGADGRPLVHVDGYTLSDGTYIEEHYRTLPDGNPYNNLSTKL